MGDAAVLRKRGYVLSGTIGEGSYGKVKAAYCQRLRRTVAVKVINKKRIPCDFLQRFLPREIEALRRLSHPSIVKTYEIFEASSGKVFIVMELGERGDLLNYIRATGAMKEDVACVAFQQLASAIKYCHDLELAHRDLKCENILLSKDLSVKLADFGFSKPLSRGDDGKLILSQTFCGSAAYAAPEVLEGIPYDPRASDIWSLGVILYTMVYALMPFDDSNVRKMIFLQKQHRIPFPEPRGRTAEFEDLVSRLLQPNVSERLCIDEVLKHSWLQTPKPAIPSPLPAAEEGECSQNPREGKSEHQQQSKLHSAEGEGEKEVEGS
ncbi:testis-specific serine/threonine-protein kinase 2 [Dryobates pubescens]|uniref:testis-specific serine/threonine-protein kinase 2 n=1 Tax=Dryobates pubescens TaxID=118200 RepID=UPI000521A37F|nr:testis-specific serine/threonine-protein kinase 2 [Dryobates pubescens]